MALAFSFALFAVAADPYAADVAAARADYTRYPTARYLWAGAPAENERGDLDIALRVRLPELSRAQVLQHCSPVQITETIYRVDTESALWGEAAWVQLGRTYPYRIYDNPLIVDAAWFLRVTADMSDSPAYQQLLYGGKPPKTVDELAKAWSIDLKGGRQYATGTTLDIGKSGVAHGARLLEHVPGVNDWWQTYDSKDGFGDKDPLENLAAGALPHDASEIIIGQTKTDLTTGETSRAQFYALADGAGKIINAADTAIVVDHTKMLGDAAIRFPVSCYSCHSAGLNGPAENTLRAWMAAGIELSAYQQQVSDEIERFYLTQQGLRIKRANEDYATYTQLTCGVEPDLAFIAYRSTIEGYDRPVTLERAAREVYATDAEELRNAIAIYSDKLGPQQNYGRLVSLAHDKPCPRAAWEGKREGAKVTLGVYHAAVEALRQWRAK